MKKRSAETPDKRGKTPSTVSGRQKAAAQSSAAADVGKKRKKHIAYMVFTAVTALMVIILAVVLRGVSDVRNYKNYMERANSYYSAGELDSALLYLRKASGIESKEECLLLMADCYETQGNLEKAVDALRRIESPTEDVTVRIASLEERRARMAETGMVTVAGNSYAAGTTGLVLDNKGLTDAVLTEIQQLYSMDNLSLAGNSISNITALSSIGGLTTLNLSNNSIGDIGPLSSLTALRTLYLDNNPVQDFSPLYSLSNLTTLSIKGIAVTESQLKAISQALPHCAIHSENAAEEAQDISLGGVTFKSDVTELDLSNLGIRDTSALSACKDLTTLNLSGNDISDLSGIMDIPQLTTLFISGNNITDLRPLMGMSTLRFINASGNNIVNTVPLGSIKGLTDLYLDNNPISNFSGLKGLRNLRTLSLNNVGLQTSDLDYFTSLAALTTLNIEENPNLSGETVQALMQTIPTCTVNHSELNFSISIDGYSVDSETTQLDLSGCGIANIAGVTRLDHLTWVSLANNNIDNIYPFQHCASSMYLTYLDISSNYLEDITAVATMYSLETLDISNNSISLIGPLLGLTNLKELRLGGNPMTPEQVAEIQAALPNCEIYTD